MSLGLRYLQKLDIEKEWDKLLIKEYLTLYSYDGIVCKKCGTIQGKPNKKLGIKKYYCDWVGKKVNKKLKKEKEKIMNKIFSLVITS